MFPYEAMPRLVQYFTALLLATHFMRMIRGIVLRGAEVQILWLDAAWLLGFSGLGLLLAAVRFWNAWITTVRLDASGLLRGPECVSIIKKCFLKR